ncbi:MAG: Rrf2 family transcriptional regulator [Victivallales bacterium]|nr:Rrf2 family transcriptional regulator [Victivallales bacterium]
MKLSTRSRYGLRLMFELALAYGSRAIQLQDIAQRQELSEKYLSKLIISLRGAKLIGSVRGAHGGYVLKRDPDKITLKEIVSSLEGGLSIVDCTENSSECERVKKCPTRDVWCGLNKVVSDYLEGITLADIVEQYRLEHKSSKDMYFI